MTDRLLRADDEPTPEATGLALAAADLPARARALTVTDEQSYHQLVDFAQGCRALRDKIAATLDPHIKRAFDTHRGLCAEKRAAEADALLAERIAKDEVLRWELAAEAARESDRLALEAAARAGAAAVVADMAQAATANGDDAAAAAILEAPLRVPVAPVRADPRPGGVSLRATWKARVTSLRALVAAAAANPVYLQMVQPNPVALDLAARSFKGQLQIPGVEAVCSVDAAIRGRK